MSLISINLFAPSWDVLETIVLGMAFFLAMQVIVFGFCLVSRQRA